jgi:hypothetical protein
MDQFIKGNRIRSDQVLQDIKLYLIKTYKQSRKVFTYATSFGQLTLVLINIKELVFSYLADAVTNLYFTESKRDSAIRGLAELVGHKAFRGASSVGQISVFLKPGSKVDGIPGGIVYFTNYLRVKCANNNLEYVLDLGTDDVIFDVNNTRSLNMNIMQGKLRWKTFTARGGNMQSYVVSASERETLDERFLKVTVNGAPAYPYDSLYDIPYRETKKFGYVVKNVVGENGFSVVFGVGSAVMVPDAGAEVRVDYMITDADLGNVTERSIYYEFVDTGVNSMGEDVDLNSFFSISSILPPDFGAAKEPIELTKVIAPLVTRNYILHDEKSIKYFLERMNFFSTVRVFQFDTQNVNNYDALLIPKIYASMHGYDYFGFDVNNLLLTDVEKVRLLNAVHESGIKSANINLNILNPSIKRFSTILHIDAFKSVNGRSTNETDLRTRIRDAIGQHMLSNTRINKVPNSDIVKLIDDLDAVDAVKVTFFCEDATMIDALGNVSAGDTSIVVMRGGFTDWNGTTYLDEYDPIGEPMGSVNIVLNFVDE